MFGIYLYLSVYMYYHLNYIFKQCTNWTLFQITKSICIIYFTNTLTQAKLVGLSDVHISLNQDRTFSQFVPLLNCSYLGKYYIITFITLYNACYISYLLMSYSLPSLNLDSFGFLFLIFILIISFSKLKNTIHQLCLDVIEGEMAQQSLF